MNMGNGDGIDESAEWVDLARSIRGDDPDAHAEAKEAMRELAARCAARNAGTRIACGRLFGAEIPTASA